MKSAMWWGVVALVAVAPRAAAHGLDPALLDIREVSAGRYLVVWKATAGGPVFPPRCRLPDPPPERARVLGPMHWMLDCGPAGLSGERIAVEGLGASRTDVLWRWSPREGPAASGVLTSETPSVVLPGPVAPAPRARGYFRLGVLHILGGADHLLLLVGLLLLERRRVQLVRTITAFTLAHSLTLALAALGVVHLPRAPVEAAIASSLLLVALELARRGPGETPPVTPAWAAAFAFGLLHGFGFAGALAEQGLPPDDIPLALVLFNLGVEAGQLAFVAVLLVVLALARRIGLRVPGRLAAVPAYALGGLAACWTIERVLDFWP